MANEELKRIPFPVTFQCGKCFHWQPIEMGRATVIGDKPKGVCFGAPPTVRPALDKHTQQLVGQGNLRPIMNEDERACGAFMPLELANGAANDLNG